MGTERGGLYPMTKAFGESGLPCGAPLGMLRSTLASMHMPAHRHFWYWNALRRLFADMGLPPIAPVPPDRMTPEERGYYVTLLARCLMQHANNAAFICADHLTALALPLVAEALAALPVRTEMLFFFSHPAAEIRTLRLEQGQAPRLSEFVWRNTVAAAVLHGGANIHFVETDCADSASLRSLADEVSAFTGMRLAAPRLPAPPPSALSHDGPSLSPLTVELYEALRDATRGGAREVLRKAAVKVHEAQWEQNGWQYLDCLDCGGIDSHARLLLAQSGRTADSAEERGPVTPETLALPQDEADWPELLDAAERRLLEARQDFETRLFLHTDSLSRYYAEQLEDARRLHARELELLRERCRKSRKRRHARLRRLLPKKPQGKRP